MADSNKFLVITCPKCGYQYAAAEVFYSDMLLGKPKDIIRDDNGRIILMSGEEPCCCEEWECEHCGHNFTAKLNIRPEVEYSSKYDFEDEYCINLKDDDKQELF